MMSVLASLASSITQFVGDRGLYAVFLLMLIDALFPAGSELVMLYAGALAAGTFAGQGVVLLGVHLHAAAAFIVVVGVGTVGYLVGALIGWGIGETAGRPLIERHGRLFHLQPHNLARSDAWFKRYGRLAVFWGRITPVVRSFVSIPAGFQRMPVAPYTTLTFFGSLIWCVFFAAIGWAIGNSYERFNSAFDYVSIVAVVLIIAALLVTKVRRRSHRQATDSS